MKKPVMPGPLSFFLVAPGLLAACAAVGGTIYLSGTAPLRIDLEPGTRLIYRLEESSYEPEAGQDVITSTVAERLSFEQRDIVDPLTVAGTEPVLGRTRVRLTGTAYRLETTGFRSVPAAGAEGSSVIWANSSAGIVRLTATDSETGRLIGPAFGLDVRPYWDGLMAWAVIAPDTTVTVPAGTFRCMATRTWYDGGLVRLSWWADGVGLIRWERQFGDITTPGFVDQVWVLAEVLPPPAQRPSSKRR